MSLAVFGSLFRMQIPGVCRWCLACGLFIVSLILLSLGRSDFLVFSASVLVLTAAFLVLQGFRQFFFLRAAPAWERAGCAAIPLGLIYWVYLSPDIDARVAMMSACLAYIRFSVAWLAWHHRPRTRHGYGYHFVCVVAVLGAIVHTVRCLASGFGMMHETTFLEATPLNILFLGMSALTLPCMAIGMVMLAHDRLAERMERLATYDDLTGVLGRRAFLVRAKALLEVAARERSRFSIAILDIDHFKRINDQHGHAVGDEALAHVASVIEREMRAIGIVGRIGGEEFAVALPSSGKEDAMKAINQLRAKIAVSEPAQCNGLACTLSAGVEEYVDGDTLSSLMARADSALYVAKAEGRNRVKAA